MLHRDESVRRSRQARRVAGTVGGGDSATNPALESPPGESASASIAPFISLTSAFGTSCLLFPSFFAFFFFFSASVAATGGRDTKTHKKRKKKQRTREKQRSGSSERSGSGNEVEVVHYPVLPPVPLLLFPRRCPIASRRLHVARLQLVTASEADDPLLMHCFHCSRLDVKQRAWIAQRRLALTSLLLPVLLRSPRRWSLLNLFSEWLLPVLDASLGMLAKQRDESDEHEMIRSWECGL